MKNKVVVIVCVLILLFVIISGLFMFKNITKNSKAPNNNYNVPIVSNTNYEQTATYDNKFEPANNIKYSYFENVIGGSVVAENITFDVLNDKEFNGTLYKDINSIVNSENSNYILNNEYLSLEKAEIANENDNNYAKVNSYFCEEPNNYNSIFKFDKEILPVRIYLQDASSNAFYEYEKTIYYIPVEQVSDISEERIVYQNGLVLYKNGNVIINDKSIIMNYTKIDNGLIEEDVQSLFNSYYSVSPDFIGNYKVYATNIDGEAKEEFIVTLYDKATNNSSATSVLKVLFKINDDSISKAVVPFDLFGNINNYNNLFYCTKNRGSIGITEVSSEYIPTYYYLYINNHFELVNRFINGNTQTDELLNHEFKTKADFQYLPYEVNGKYNLGVDDMQNSGDNSIKYIFINSATPSNSILQKGTSFRIVKLINNDGNAIIRTENGDIFILNNN